MFRAPLSLLPIYLSMKTCTKCGIEKPPTEFHKDASRDGGLQQWCKPCQSAAQVAWYRNYPERAKEVWRVASLRYRGEPGSPERELYNAKQRERRAHKKAQQS